MTPAVGAPVRAAAPPLSPRAIGALAARALREELELWPKPGLVSPRDPGAHGDMDASTFAASLRALRGFFPAAAGAGAAGLPFERLRALGLRAEARMLAATAGVNTHRGAIFSLGLLAAAAGRLAARPRTSVARRSGASGGMAEAALDAPALREAVRAFSGALRSLPAAGTHGAAVARRHGVGGARAEAAAGFPHLFDVALPALVGARRRGADRRAAAVEALLATVAVLADTNLLWRGGPAALAFARGGAREFLRAGGVHRPGWEDHARSLHAEFVARRLSPGGSADLLAGALFVDALGARAGSP